MELCNEYIRTGPNQLFVESKTMHGGWTHYCYRTGNHKLRYSYYYMSARELASSKIFAQPVKDDRY